MLKKISILLFSIILTACSSITSYIPFMDSDKKVINLDKDRIDQKSYASAYEATVATYKGRVNENFYVDNFASGANDWYLGRILVPIKQIQDKLYTGGHDSDVYAYYSGVLHAEALQANFNRLSQDCWQKLDPPSITQGIYDAMRDLKKGKVRSEDDDYIAKGSDTLLKVCTTR
ncbi:hypothetical protein [Rodentibacter trehalosifermentans]|uniref:Lipoprotein n=1 Tax=Rodentibacter trehalosifermentans TaxID=1908263 RepID=A0A1V3J0M1_9PAST|nr:hypothetical protein [Rodentibacter trehalosifermentans]OOF46328.1 hypothetical protein BKK51_02790 [Rodentibacter trehalosifermentans]OOF48463.1 hypothetical protein BKK52_05735 [Rodentibacter trehalosifermentans]OOF53249.1 hypothetical protein BKK53_01990 [Rodentibacter trehalosifermentans]